MGFPERDANRLPLDRLTLPNLGRPISRPKKFLSRPLFVPQTLISTAALC